MASEEARNSVDSNGRSNADGALSVETPVDARKSTDSAHPSAFQAAIGAWRNIDLTTLQKSLDATASEIVNSQRDSLVERKELAQKTKEYRKLDAEAQKEEWRGLLKSYQIFIDHLTATKKNTETSFLSLYSTLSEAPDPYPLLEATVESLANLSDIQALTKENTSLNATVSRLTSQVSNLEASLHAKNKELERKTQEREEEVKRSEEVYKGVLDEKTRNWESKEKALTEKLEHQEEVLKEIKASYEVAQRMGGSGQSPSGEEDMLVKERTAELEIVTRDLERTTLRLAEVEGRNEQLRRELEQASSHDSNATEQSKPVEEEDESVISRLQEENAKLLRKIDSAKAEVEGQKREAERKLRTLERTVKGLQEDKEVLKGKVTKYADYEDIRRELEILKSIEFSTGDDDDEDDDVLDFSKTGTADDSFEPGAKDGKKETLEQLLLARNKKLGNELTILRVSHQDLSMRLQSLQETLDSTTAELTAAQNLNQKLEDDLLKFQHETQQQSSALSVAGTYVSRFPQSSFGGNRRVSPASSIISGQVPHNGAQTSLEALRAGEGVGGGSGILPMVTAQRDRFKQRNQQLEDELARTQSTISNLRQEISSLQKDNIQLYEKTRYISSYSRQPSTVAVGSAAASSGFGANSNPASNLNSTSSSLSIDRYRQAYEANISPFEAFRGRESARAYHRMGVVERMLYSLTRVILANRTSRNLFAAYCVLLHLLVFSMLYWAGTAHVEKHLPAMADLDAAAAVAGGVAAAGDAAAARPGDWHPQEFDERL